MIGYGAFSGLTLTALALATILSALVSLIGAGARRLAVEEQRAEAKDLSELTGIIDPKELQDVFGPPDMGRVWRRVTLADITRARRPLGQLISGRRTNWLSIGFACLAVISPGPVTILLLFTAMGTQIGGWLAASQLPK